MTTKKTPLFLIGILIVLIFLLAGCAKKDNNVPPVCGNNACETGENPTTCAADCPPNQPPENNKLGAGEYPLTIQLGNQKRTYLVHAPASYNKNQPTPVILNFHGGGGNANNQMQQSQMNKKSDSAGFIAVYPEGTGTEILGKLIATWNAGKCCGAAERNNVDDVSFVNKLLDDLEAKFNVDSKRIYATGLSNGSLFSFRLACELSDRIAAIGPVSGQDPLENCNPSRKMPVIYFHGTDDPAAKFEGGQCGGRTPGDPGWQCMSAPDYMDQWRTRNGCSAETKVVYQNKGATCTEYQECQNNADVEFCTIQDGGHTWPSGQYAGGLNESSVGKISNDISANDEMWKFFQQHSLE